ncbi:MAG TPA: hypothetical protein VG406_17510 [Isosphaeraceae bacterium]|jgi:hypothetical protein|nr:hypothetical protein [Isosphaeraceae bacterium]
MNGDRRGRRPQFRPTLDGRLESRCLLASHRPVLARTALEGRGVIITDSTGERFRVFVTDFPFTSDGGPTMQARPAPNGQVDLYIYGATPNTTLEVDPLPHNGVQISPQGIQNGTPQFGLTYTRMFLRNFPQGTKNHDGLLHIRNIIVPNGTLGSILAYRTASLSGSLILPGTTPVDRIALEAVNPGATIATGGDINTLDIFDNLSLSGAGTGLSVGRDLNWMSVGGNVTATDGANFLVGRDVGLVAQPAKGTDTGGQGGLIGGDLAIVAPSVFAVGRALDAPLLVRGHAASITQFSIPSGGQNLTALGGFS